MDMGSWGLCPTEQVYQFMKLRMSRQSSLSSGWGEEQLIMMCTWTWIEVDHQLISRMMVMMWQSLVLAEISVSRRRAP